MPRDPEAEGALLVLTVKAALAPVLERVAGLEARVTQALAVEPAVAALRDRVVVVETKSSTPALIEVPDTLSPVLERLAVADAKLGRVDTLEHSVGDVRDRLLAMETKAAITLPVVEPLPDTLTPVLERLAVTDARLGRVETLEQNVGDVRDRLLTLETKAALPVPIVEAPHDTLTPVLERLAATDARLARLAAVELTVGELHDKFVSVDAKAARAIELVSEDSPNYTDMELAIRKAQEPLTKELAAAHERIAVLETRASVPGPAGKDGVPGLNGKDGHDGADGVTLDDLSLVQENDRTMVVKGTVGARVKDIGTLTFPSEIYRGVYVDGKTYERGDCVTWGGSEWHANETTTSKPGDGSKAWTLKVKRGRDGKDGRDAETAPVVSLGRPQ